MAVLDDTTRANIAANLMREWSNDRESVAALKPDVRAMVNALDDFMDAHATDVNNAIPQPARSQFTVGQKARALARIVLARWGGV